MWLTCFPSLQKPAQTVSVGRAQDDAAPLCDAVQGSPPGICLGSCVAPTSQIFHGIDVQSLNFAGSASIQQLMRVFARYRKFCHNVGAHSIFLSVRNLCVTSCDENSKQRTHSRHSGATVFSKVGVEAGEQTELSYTLPQRLLSISHVHHGRHQIGSRLVSCFGGSGFLPTPTQRFRGYGEWCPRLELDTKSLLSRSKGSKESVKLLTLRCSKEKSMGIVGSPCSSNTSLVTFSQNSMSAIE